MQLCTFYIHKWFVRQTLKTFMKTSHRTIVNDYKNHDQIKSLDELKYSQPALVTTSALLSNNFYPATCFQGF
jgi:hypothetical protein